MGEVYYLSEHLKPEKKARLIERLAEISMEKSVLIEEQVQIERLLGYEDE